MIILSLSLSSKPRILHVATIFWFIGIAFIATSFTVTAADTGERAQASSPLDEVKNAKNLFDAIVKVRAKAISGARSISSLGAEREGSGILIGDDGLILTIGYLVVEAREVEITDARGRRFPANIVGYDHVTGLGLLKAIIPFDATPMSLGDSSQLNELERVMVVNSGGPDEVALAYIVSLRKFTANWEYQLEQAIFTSPPSMNWSGAALINKEGKLIGVGSLIVRDATQGHPPVPGNMFIPINGLKPILSDLIKSGRRSGPARPWLGVSADEVQGRLFITRVSPDGPGDSAGMHVGDIVLAVGNEPVKTQAEFYERVWQRGSAGIEIPLRVLQGVDVKDLKLQSIDRVDYFIKKPTF